MQLIGKLRPLFKTAGCPLPKLVRASCGFPSCDAIVGRKIRGAEVWGSGLSEGGWYEIFISPLAADSLHVAEMMTHELVHCAAGLRGCGHGAMFCDYAAKVGLVKSFRESNAGGTLRHRLKRIVKEIGPYPHSRLILSDGVFQ